MLDLIELTNLEVLFVMGLAFSMGFLFAVVMFLVPCQTKLDTERRNSDRKLDVYRRELANIIEGS